MTRPVVIAVALAIPLLLRAQAPLSDGATRIPLRAGLTIVTALNDARGDYESIKRVTDLNATTMTVTYSTDVPLPDDTDPLAALLGNCQQSSSGSKKRVQGSVMRVVRREDLDRAHSYHQHFNICAESTESFPGTTALGVSSAVLKELNAQGSSRLSVMSGGPAGALAGMLGSLLGADTPELAEVSMASGVLTRVERGTVPVRVIVNNMPVELPAVHARGNLGDEAAEFWILADEANPLSLRWSLADGRDRLQVIKLFYSDDPKPASKAPEATAAGASRIEHDLAETGTSVIYGIYFDFASDRIKPESEEVLAEIATVMRQHPAWSLSVDGHTDGIGGAAANVDLSKRRAAAVKQALVTRYQIDANRLKTAGYGASRPKDTNDTIEGRARNRRVELRRQ